MQKNSSIFIFEAAVQRPLNVVFKSSQGLWGGHDYIVEIVVERKGLDAFDVVIDFRELESALDELLGPVQGKLLSDIGLNTPQDLMQLIAKRMSEKIILPSRLREVNLVDGHQRRFSLTVTHG